MKSKKLIRGYSNGEADASCLGFIIVLLLMFGGCVIRRNPSNSDSAMEAFRSYAESTYAGELVSGSCESNDSDGNNLVTCSGTVRLKDNSVISVRNECAYNFMTHGCK
jgi:hypothetical protein